MSFVKILNSRFFWNAFLNGNWNQKLIKIWKQQKKFSLTRSFFMPTRLAVRDLLTCKILCTCLLRAVMMLINYKEQRHRVQESWESIGTFLVVEKEMLDWKHSHTFLLILLKEKVWLSNEKCKFKFYLSFFVYFKSFLKVQKIVLFGGL